MTVTSIRPRWAASPGWPTRAGHARDRERRALLRLVREFSFQAAEKHVLAEGEKFVLALFQGGYDQGVFSLVANLGEFMLPLREGGGLTLKKKGRWWSGRCFSRSRKRRSPPSA